jgi:hypothetical protein
MSAELTALALGRLIATKAAHAWLAARVREQERNLDLSDLVRTRVPGLRAQRSIERQFEQLADTVADRLDAILASEFRNLSVVDQRAALAAVAAALARADLSDRALMGVDIDADRLYRKLITAEPPDVSLGDTGQELYQLVLRECCICYIKVIRSLPPFTERAVSELLRRTTEILAEVGRVLEQLPTSTLFAAQTGYADDEFEQMYLQMVASELDEVELFSVIPGITLRTKLSVAYISLSVDTALSESKTRFHRHLRDYQVQHESAPVEIALGRSKRTLVRGEAGSGKTTLLRWLAVMSARRELTGTLLDWNDAVPFFIKLRTYSTGAFPEPKQFIDSVAHVLAEVMPTRWVERILTEGRALLLIDGIDELAESDRQPAHAWIRQLTRAYPSNRVIVTSRPAVVTADWLSKPFFASVMMEPMTPSDQQVFVRHWHDAMAQNDLLLDPNELSRYESTLMSALTNRSELKALAETPLLAAMLCALNLHKRRQLPRSRMELYKMAVELLLQRDAARDIPSSKELSLNLSDKIFILSDLAWRLSDNNLTELDVERTTSYIQARINTMPSVSAEVTAVFHYLMARSGILREPSQGQVDFIHRTFQEYFASLEAASEDRIGNLIGRAHLPQWRETIIMAAGHCTSRQKFELISGIYEQIRLHGGSEQKDDASKRSPWLLIAACIETMTTVPEELADIVDECLEQLIPPRDLIDALSLAQAGQIVFKKLTNLSLKAFSAPEVRATIRMVSMIGGAQAFEFLANLSATAPDPVTISALLAAWDYFDPEEYAAKVLARIEFRHHVVCVNNPAQLASLPLLPYAERVEIAEAVQFEAFFIDHLNNVRKLQRLKIDNFHGGNNLAPFSVLSDLEALQITGGGVLDREDSFARFSKLASLELSAWTELPRFSSNRFPSRLERLHLGWLSSGFDCESLTHCKRLRVLRIEVADEIINLEALAAINVGYLYILGPISYDATLGNSRMLVRRTTERHLGISSLDALRSLHGLRTLALRGLAPGTDLSVIASMPSLKELDISDARGELDLQPLSGNWQLHVTLNRGQPVRGVDTFRRDHLHFG